MGEEEGLMLFAGVESQIGADRLHKVIVAGLLTGCFPAQQALPHVLRTAPQLKGLMLGTSLSLPQERELSYRILNEINGWLQPKRSSNARSLQ